MATDLKKRPLTHNQVTVLMNLAAGKDADDGITLRTQSDYGGWSTIVYSLVRRGLIAMPGGVMVLTDEGRRIAELTKPKQEQAGHA